jgi:hypothetical protein
MLRLSSWSRRGRVLPIVLALAAPAPLRAEAPRSLSFADRVACQGVVEEVYHSHQIGTTRTFREAVRRDVLERKARRAVEGSAALERFWDTPVDGRMLRAELERIARDTRFPARLRQIYEALEDDPFLVEECFVRPVLVDRLLRGFQSGDTAIQAPAWAEAAALRARLASGELDPAAVYPGRRVVELRRADEMPGGDVAAGDVVPLTDAELARRRAQLPERIGEPGPVEETRDAFRLRLLLSEGPDHLRIAAYEVPKVAWSDWWEAARQETAIASLPPRVPGSAVLPRPGVRPGRLEEEARTLEAGVPESCTPDDIWDGSPFDDQAPTWRPGEAAVWTGSQLIVWGGGIYGGGRYDPLTDTWSPVTGAGEPPGNRQYSTAIWTGDVMIVWGGGTFSAPTNTGGRYDPATDSWTPTSTVNAPAARRAHSAVWTGTEMVVWGGFAPNDVIHDTGGRYDPATDTWAPTSLVGAPAARGSHTAAWTGSEMLVWGGDGGTYLDTGGRYDPSGDTWMPIATTGVPAARLAHAAVWTGGEMVVWGGYDGTSFLDTGGRYDPATDSWDATSTAGAPTPRRNAGTVWTGTEMAVWGGLDAGYLDTGALYDPAADTWRDISAVGAPAPREAQVAVWTGDRMIVWGGDGLDPSGLRSGGGYDPVSDIWTPTSTGAVPAPDGDAGLIWTGNRLLVFGGGGGRYDPLTDGWSPIVDGLAAETVVWSGTLAIGYKGSLTGFRYDPLADSWAPISAVNAPSPRQDPVAAWTGSEMVIWGGNDGLPVRTGGRYDPVADTWRPTSLTGAPAIKKELAGVWTGSEMIVWGGYSVDPDRSSDTGARYDPVTDTWTPTSLNDAPSRRRYHTAVWTGDRMIVWGGQWDHDPLDTGALYDPETDTWTAVSTVGAPSARGEHEAVWTGSHMIVWGNGNGTGGRYDPATDTWLPTSTVDAPADSTVHGKGAVWIGTDMVIWGSVVGGSGLYALEQSADVDGDGSSVCAGDCDDGDALTYPGATEICDGRDNDCDGSVPPDEVDADRDGAPACDDCDDAEPLRFPGSYEYCDNLDNDCDGTVDDYVSTCGIGACASTGYCSGGVDSCAPAAPSPEICNMVDDDCDGTLPDDEIDIDGDGVAACIGDCDDYDEARYPAAVEQNNGQDDQCPGDPGYGMRDEISGTAGFFDAVSPDELCWPPQPRATAYEVFRSPLADFSGSCTRVETMETCWSDPEVPPPGEVRNYLLQSNAPYAGSLGAGGAGQERQGLCGSENLCSDGVDNDGDGRIDCGDGDCLRKGYCSTAIFAFTTSEADDVPATALEAFFQDLEPTPADHVSFLLLGGATGTFRLCLERADWYRDQYLVLAAGGGTAGSGSWDKWYSEGSGWTGPDIGSYPNYFGSWCADQYAWCPEWLLAGHMPGVNPGEAGICEAFDGFTCQAGLTLRIDVGDRQSACGF